MRLSGVFEQGHHLARVVPCPDAAFDLTGRRAVVTGASAGIGAAVAARLAHAGADVVAVSRSGQVPEAEGSGRPLAADLSDAEAVDGVIDRAVSELGGLDMLVNNRSRPATRCSA